MLKRSLFALCVLIMAVFSACSDTVDTSKASHKSQAEGFMALTFDCPNKEMVDAASTVDGSYISEGSFVSGSGETAADKFKVIFKDYVVEDYVEDIISSAAIPMAHISAAENGSSSKFESISMEESPTENQYSFTTEVLCTKYDGTQIPVTLSGSIRFDGDGKIEMLKFTSGYNEYYEAISP